MNNNKAYTMLHQEKELPYNPGRPLSYNDFTDKKKKKQNKNKKKKKKKKQNGCW